MISSVLLYLITSIVMISPWPALWRKNKLSTLRMIVLLFALDTVLTIEAALYSDIVMIALLHVITVPAFIALIYMDILKQHNAYFKCFICGKVIRTEEQIETISRISQGRPMQVIVHTSCVELEKSERKTISSRVFRNGIPK